MLKPQEIINRLVAHVNTRDRKRKPPKAGRAKNKFEHKSARRRVQA